MSIHRTGLPIVDSLTDSLNSPLAPRVLGVANEVQLAAFRSPGTWQQHLESPSSAAARHAESDEAAARILSVVDKLRLAAAACERPDLPASALGREVSAVLSELEALLNSRRVVEVGSTSGPVDPVHHDVAASEASPDIPRGHIKRMLHRAAVCDGRLVRRALVIASSGPAAS